ncbi:MAG: SDR family NAD(P)-dependent oxidoreductase [Candidatus Eremiobacteraeota bacterium]|nr:SDR family NAD(P)-dependent oxidoreductase [Candidatus Eremiobacteraeota bacterium]
MTTPAPTDSRLLALVTGGSSGIGLELAKLFAADGHDVVIASNDAAELDQAAKTIRASSPNAHVESVTVDLATHEGPQQLYDAVRGMRGMVDVLADNAGVGVYGDFARETDLDAELRMIHLNVLATVHLTKLIVRDMVARGSGKILVTASMAALTPTPKMTLYGATKAFLYSFAEGLRAELDGTGVTVTALLPGGTDTEFFERADMEGTKLGDSKKADPADVAKTGYDALMKNEDHVVAGWSNKLAAALLKLAPIESAAKRAKQ